VKVLRTMGCCVSGCLLALASALADVGPGDMQVLARASTFLEKPPVGDVSMGVVYSPGSAQSLREAATVQKLLDGGLTVGNLTLRAVAVPVRSWPRECPAETAGLNEEAQGVAALSRERHIPCVTTDLAQVQSGTCPIGIRWQPKIEILVNRAAAAANGTSFSTIFRMMVKEI
jgi:hypothetical protein